MDNWRREQVVRRAVMNAVGATAHLLVYMVLAAVIFIPFIVHVVVTVKTNWAAMLILGLVLPPVGWMHGVGVIFGFW